MGHARMIALLVTNGAHKMGPPLRLKCARGLLRRIDGDDALG